MMTIKIKFVIAFLAMATVHQVTAGCNLRFASTLSPSYSMNGLTRQQISFTVSSNKKYCPHFVTVSPGGDSSYQRKLTNPFYSNSFLPFQLYQSDVKSVLKHFPEGSSTNFLFPLQFDKTMEHRFRAVLSLPYIFAPAGRYFDRYTFRIYEGTPNYYAAAPDDIREVEFFYILEERISISLVANGAPFDFYNKSFELDFGALSRGQRKSFDIVVLSNAGMELSISSMNDGAMTSLTNNGKVNYRMSFDGGAFRSMKGTLGAPYMIKSESGVLPLRGRRIRTEVEISSLSEAQSGSYSDNLVITAATVY